jgi:hypothetical protein
MKKLLFILLLFPLIAMGQNEPFKGANTLVIKSDSEITFDQVMKRLIQDGFEIKDSNPEYGLINTGWKFYQNTIYYRLSIVVEGNQVTFRGSFKNDMVNAVFNAQTSETPITWAKSGGFKYLWGLMDTFGSNFGTQKEYFKK